MVNGACRIAAAAYTGDEVIGIIATNLLLELELNFLADDALQFGDHLGIGVRTDRTAYDVEGVARMAAPVADGFVRRILQRLVATLNGEHFGSEHLHSLHIDVLAFNVQSAHINAARHSHQGADSCGCNAVLSGSCLGDDAFLSHASGQKNLTDGIVYLVSTRMVQVFALQVEPTAIFLAHALGKIERAGTTHIVAQ